MKQEVTAGGRRLEVEVATSGGKLRVRVDGRELHVEEIWHDGGRELSLLVDGRSYDVEVVPGAGHEVAVLVGGRRIAVELGRSAERRAAAGGARAGGGAVRAPMPGKVVTLLVEPGSRVEPGQGVVVIEAMKMENELVAPVAGEVKGIHVRPGQTVEGGALLVEIA